jgi:CHAT domain-containing protein
MACNVLADTVVAKTAYDNELIIKGLLLASEISLTNTIMESGDTALISEYETMKTAHLQLNKELEKPIAERIYNCDSLENEIQKMERHIMEKSKEFGDVTHFIKIDWKEVQNSLKPNDVAIEFSNFIENDTTKFVALVLTKNIEAPICVPLFNNYEMQKLQRGITPAKNETSTDDENRGATTVAAKRQGIYESKGLYDMLWKPLEKYFPENPRIFFAPSGMLHQIAVEYAPTGNGKTISDKYEIYRVSSTRFLAMDYMPKPFKNSVLYGGIYYDSDTTTMKQESDRYSTRSATSYTSFADFNRYEDRGSLNYLPGTKTEVEDIVGKLKKKRIKSQLYEGSQANEESFKALSGSDISVLHIATHGFFLPTDEKLSGDQSLIQSGLLLSGANYAWQNKPLPEGVEDGILTAKEISFMDLRKTDLVVLSACQTALGEITGEGVFGLQRGFKKAGVRTIIMSLWPVDDNATLLMMTEFYTNLTKGMSKREAFLAAQNKVKTTEGFANPRFWAAFIMLDGNEK